MELTDKIRSMISRPGLYLAALFAICLGSIATVADILGAINLFEKRDAVLIALLAVVAVYGFLNLILVADNQKMVIRLERESGAFAVIHQITELLRDYRTLRQNGSDFDSSKWCHAVVEICNKFHGEYLSPRHNGNVAMTLKYLHEDSIHSIRIGPGAQQRSSAPESKDDSFVFGLFCRPEHSTQKTSFVFVQDVNNLSKEDLRILGDYTDKIKARATLYGYKTFIALPIKTGNLNSMGHPVIKETLGFVGFDMARSNAFGELPDQERECMSAFVDALSELIRDYRHIVKTVPESGAVHAAEKIGKATA